MPLAASFKSVLARLGNGRDQGLKAHTTAPEGQLFPATDPAIDGDACLHDCDTCTIKLPSKWKIDLDDKLYGGVNGWSTHLLVATGKTDWVRDVADEKGSVMEAVGKHGQALSNGKLMLSASNMPVPEGGAEETTVLVLPAFVFVDHVSPATTPALLDGLVAQLPTNTSPLGAGTGAPPQLPSPLAIRDCPYKYLVLLCSQKTRDARCGQSAPLLRREFERHLRPLGLHRDLADARPGGCGVYFISHVGGHKYSANVLIYRRAGGGEAGEASEASEAGPADGQADGQPASPETPAAAPDTSAAQCIWLARVRPEHVENIVRYTLLQGKVVGMHAGAQLRGGFDRARGVASW